MNKHTKKIFRRFKMYVQKNNLIKKNDTILISYSGGADSTALLYCLWKIKNIFNLKLIALHINYQLRGEESESDQNFAVEQCFNWGIPVLVKKVKIESDTSIEERARKIRYKFYKELIPLYKIDKIALGHNKNDQAETMLFKFFRGAGLNGLSGIRPRSKNIIHPLLDFSRKEIRHFLISMNQKWRDDSSNLQKKFTRNKLRLEIIPWINQHINSNFINTVTNMAEVFNDNENFLVKEAKRKMHKIEHRKSNSKYIELDLSKLLNIDKSLFYYIFHECYQRISNQELGFFSSHFEDIFSVLHKEGSKIVNLPNSVIVIKEYNKLIFSTKQYLDFSPKESSREIKSIRKSFSFNGNRIKMKHLKSLPRKNYPFEDKDTAYLDLDKLSFPLIFRYRQEGDRFKPLGMKNFKKLKDFFIDEKVPKLKRNKIIVIEDNDKKIVWLVGKRIDQRTALSADTKNILQINVSEISENKKRPARRIKELDND